MDDTNDKHRQHWLWVTRPEFYLDEDGFERTKEDLSGGGGWWTCHRSTKKGDLALLWRTAPRSDIGYLVQARSDAESIADDPDAAKRGWDYGCDYTVLYKFKEPLGIADLRRDPYLSEWTAIRGRFQHRVFLIPDEYWKRINRLAASREAQYRRLIERIEQRRISRAVIVEEKLENYFVENLPILKKFGHDVELYMDSARGICGRQLVCKGDGGRIDLLCRYRNRNAYLVIELKSVPATLATLTQILSYMGWLKKKSTIAGRAAVFGLVISPGCDPRFQSALNVCRTVFQLNFQLDSHMQAKFRGRLSAGRP